ncbi:MAG: AMP-binding protein [Candidatus Rokuibacteriota bacterium]
MRTLQSLSRSLSGRGDRLAVHALPGQEGAEQVSFADLGDRVRRLAGGLAEVGVRRGEPVAVWAPNRPEWIVVCLAILDAGAVVVPMDVQARDDQVSHLLTDSESRRLFTTREHLARLEKLATPAGLGVFLLDAPDDDDRSWHRLLRESPPAPTIERPEVRPGDPAVLFYTSGTTGPPKGVPLTHANCVANLRALLDVNLVGPDDRVLLPLPFHHVYPFVIGILAPLAAGAALVLPASLTGPEIVRALQVGRVTAIIGVPRLYEALIAGLQARVRGRGRIAAGVFTAALRLSAWLRRWTGLRVGRALFRPLHTRFGPRVRMVASGGAKLEPDLAWKLEGLGWQVATGYGLTETSPILTFNVPGEGRFDTAGRPLSGVELKIGEPNEKGAGEVLARGPNVFAGYRNLPEKTRKAFTDEGWFRTGDLGTIDPDGHLRLVGRASEMIVLAGGKNVSPEDVEDVYAASPVIREAGVLERGGRLAAVIVPDVGEIRKRGAEVEEAIRTAVAAQSRQLPPSRRVSGYATTRESVQRTRLGKIRRHLLPELYERAKRGEEKEGEVARPASPEELSPEDRTLLENAAAMQAWKWLVARYPDRRLTPDTSPQLDLGVDSLEWVNLTLEMRERAGVDLSEEAIAEVAIVRDLLRAAAEASGAGERAAGLSPLERPEEALSEQQKRWLTPPGPVLWSLGIPVYALNRSLIRGLFGLTVQGGGHLPRNGPFVLTPNHRSYLDPLVIAAALPLRTLRRMYWGGAITHLFSNPMARLLSRIAQVVPVDPQRAAMSSLALGAAVLDRRRSLVWFPEGRRSPSGELQPFLPGVGMLLERFQVTAVPVFIHGTDDALPPGRMLPRFRPLRIVFGDPLDPRTLAEQGQGEEARDRIADALHDAVGKLGEGSRAGQTEHS